MTHSYDPRMVTTTTAWATCRQGHTKEVTFYSCICCVETTRQPEGGCPVCTVPVKWSERRNDLEEENVWPPDEEGDVT